MVSQKPHPQSSGRLLDELAALFGVQPRYRDAWGHVRESPRESIEAVLVALGAELPSGGDRPASAAQLRTALARRREELDSQLIPPVVVAWEGVLPPEVMRRAASERGGAHCVLVFEGGEERSWSCGEGVRNPKGSARNTTGAGPGRLPLGYHRLCVETRGSMSETTVISAPRRCWAPAGPSARVWGVFAPLYALSSGREWGAGDLAELGALADAVGAAGGSLVSTLPLLASFLDRPFEPGPYRPVSRLFWNEFYLHIEALAEWERCSEARELWASDDVQTRIAGLRADRIVDYRGVMAAKRLVLERLNRCLLEGRDPARMAALSEYVRAHPEADAYAAFRARGEAEAAGLDPIQTENARLYHLYCQWQMEEQMDRLSEGTPAGLFLDLPVGVHPNGFDRWRWSDSYASGMSFGAPADGFFTRGQDWDCPPLHPERARVGGHQQFVRALRHHMRHARFLRIDHVMALHRLFWIPEGHDATGGVYVTYLAEEQYAVLCLESHRHQTVVVGEDLGTVPPGVRSSMRRHGLLGTWVLQGALKPRSARALDRVPAHVVAGLGTHDMFPFAGYARGDDIVGRLQAGQVTEEGARSESAARRTSIGRLAAELSADEQGLLPSTLARLSAGKAQVVMVNVEDLLLETIPQNQPGTGAAHGNWRRKAAGNLDDIRRAVAEIATSLHRSGSER